MPEAPRALALASLGNLVIRIPCRNRQIRDIAIQDRIMVALDEAVLPGAEFRRGPVGAPAVGSLDWDDVRVFLAVARHGSLRAAGRALGLSQPTIGRRLASF
ncbi:MAG TPA: LysR family transcriptional regulator, partial [Stellaceae bacterium]|nr:LysR family transcriptional regulator [Stellaceae bacterium]